MAHNLPTIGLVDHRFEVPLAHTHPRGPQIEVRAREVTPIGSSDHGDKPMLVFLQGGPGFGAPRPNDNSGWIGKALESYRVLLLDERGTGRSSPLSFQTLARLGSPDEQAAYLKHFRSDSIVSDCECVRRELLGESTPWSVLGQSYGGFCAAHYLSVAPHGLREAFITGGLPQLAGPAEDVYRLTYPICARKNREYYERYPDDVERIRRIADHIAVNSIELPSGGPLTVRKFQTLGLSLGFSDGFEAIHYLVEQAFVDGARGPELSYLFLRNFENTIHFDTNPIFSILHEACYTQGARSNWAAERLRGDYPDFDPAAREPLFLTGEMIYPWFFEEFPTLAPLREAAELLAQDEDWPRLYDMEVLAANDVPAAAAVYSNDMYVPCESSQQTAAAIKGLQPWVTDEFEHNGLRVAGPQVLGHLMELVDT
ncbi:MAG: alpha/beta fold hydrolase [Planctomycetota bacterium]|nr:alpha/beta fold hydrolase [Planctomycetota bacterium]